MKSIIKAFIIIVSICFISKKSIAQSTTVHATAVKQATQKTIAVPVKSAALDSATKKTALPDPVAAIARQGIEVVKPATIVIVKLPQVSLQEAKAKKE